MPEEHPDTGNGAPEADNGRLPQHYKWPLVAIGCAVALVGAALREPVITVAGLAFIAVVLKLKFDPFKWLK